MTKCKCNVNVLDFNPHFSSGLHGVVIRQIQAAVVMRERALDTV